MNKIVIALLFTISAGLAWGQSDLNMTLIGQLPMPSETQDVWGFLDSTGTEYAVVGTDQAARIVSLADPSNPKIVYVAEGPNSRWRDIKYYNGFLYVTHDEGNQGVTIIDASSAPDTFSHTHWNPEVPISETVTNTLTRAHNVYIDTRGIMYIAGSRIGKRGVALFDLKDDPLNPTYLSRTNTFYSHDAYVQDDILYSSELSNGFGIYDVSDVLNPVEIGRGQSSSDFTHNAWVSEDGLTLYTTDEVSGGFLDAYDISVPSEPRFLDKYSPLETREKNIVIPHNTHVIGDFAVTSWYTDGVVINDISRPDNIVRVGQYDTYHNEANLNLGSKWFHGCWGAYPYLPSGLILVSDIETGLYVFEADYQKASFLEGHVFTVNNDNDTIPVVGATVLIESEILAFDESNQLGEFKTGIARAGQHLVVVSHPFYDTKNNSVFLSQGQVVERDFFLSNQSYNSLVVDEVSQNPIADAKINITNFSNEADAELTTSDEGVFSLTVRSQDDNRLTVSQWEYLSQVFMLDGDNILPQVIEMEKGYSDNFASDLGWVGVDSSSTGNWIRATPQLFFLNGEEASPGKGASGDGDFKALITGNGGNQIGNDDIDGGETSIISPSMDFTNDDAVTIFYKTWFYNEGGDTPPDDRMSIVLGNGNEEIVLEEINTSSSLWSELKQFTVTSDQISFTDAMYVKVLAGDYGNPHIVKAGFDQFLVTSGIVSGNDNSSITQLKFYPNPTTGPINIDLDINNEATLSIYTMEGRRLMEKTIDSNTIDVSMLPVGIYTIRIESDGYTHVSKLIKH